MGWGIENLQAVLQADDSPCSSRWLVVAKATEKQSTLSLLSDSSSSNYWTSQRTSIAPLLLSPIFYSYFELYVADEAAVMENATLGCESVTQDVMAEVISPGPNFSGNWVLTHRGRDREEWHSCSAAQSCLHNPALQSVSICVRRQHKEWSRE